METSTVRKIKSSDGKIFEIEEKHLEMSQVLKDLAKDFPDTEAELPVNEVDGKTLEKIIEYIKYHETEKPKDIPKPLPGPDLKPILSQWDYDFITPLSLKECVDLINGANFLNVPTLITLVAARLASEMINCEVEEARAKFGIEPDMTQEEMDEYDRYPLD